MTFILALALVALVAFTAGFLVEHGRVRLYKSRWQTATALLNSGDEDGEDGDGVGSVVNGWTIECCVWPNCYWTHNNVHFDGVALRLRKDKEVVKINYATNERMLDPAEPNFDKKMKRYRETASTVARSL
jgi:hypothetical protein